jgi:hypothetical protein
MESCDSFGIYRRFGQLHVRLLLAYMADITDIEKQLQELDRSDEEGGEKTLYRLKNRYHKKGLDTTKRELMGRVEGILIKYGILTNHRQ